VEFSILPAAPETFLKVLDDTLKQLNTDYRTKRTGDVGMVGPRLFSLPRGTFYEWMRSRGKLGGQNKVPRVMNGRAVADGLLGVAGHVNEAFVMVTSS
jgi:GH3 auxin-responsive promoter